MKSILSVIVLSVLLSAGAFAEDNVISNIEISPVEIEVIVGEEVIFSAEASDSEGSVIEAEFVWTVDGEIGTIDDDGEFKATAVGTGTVVASVGEVSAEANVKVSEEEGEGGKGGDGGNGGDGGEGGDGDGTVEESFEIFPDNAWVAIEETVQFEVELGGADENADVIWEVDDTEIGTIDENGLFTAIKEGETFVVVSVGEFSDQAEVKVTEEGPPQGEGGNTIRIQRQKEDGKITQFGSALTENNSVTIGGIPHPMNYLNGMKLFFPENSLSDDITITIKIPKFAKIDNTKKEVTFEGDIISAVTFEVSVDGVVVSPYEFDTPLEVTLPYKKGLLTQLGIDPEDMGMYFVGQEGELVREGIAGVQLDSEAGVISGMVAHFSDIALAPQYSPTTVEENQLPEGFTLSQNYPNPFNPETIISYGLSEAIHVKINIYNVLGQNVRILVDELKPAGSYSIKWDGENEAGNQLTNGVYIYRMEAGNFSFTRKLMLMK